MANNSYTEIERRFAERRFNDSFRSFAPSVAVGLAMLFLGVFLIACVGSCLFGVPILIFGLALPTVSEIVWGRRHA
jgi:fatty acid desaturase